MSQSASARYDVFISYSHVDQDWVRTTLLPRLEADGLRVCIDYRDFELGIPSLINMERAVADSRRTLTILTPAWVRSEWTAFESLLVGTTDPIGRRQRLIPLMLQLCRPPDRIAMLTYADFTQPQYHEEQFKRLIHTLKQDHPEIHPTPADELRVIPPSQLAQAPAAVAAITSLSERRRASLVQRLSDLIIDYEAANNQFSMVLEEVQRTRIKRQIATIEQEIQDIERQIQNLQ